MNGMVIPKKMCPCSSPWKLWGLPYLGKEFFQMYEVKHFDIRRALIIKLALDPISSVLKRGTWRRQRRGGGSVTTRQILEPYSHKSRNSDKHWSWEEASNGFFLKASRSVDCRHLDFRLRDFRTVREHISVVNHPVCGTSVRQSYETDSEPLLVPPLNSWPMYVESGENGTYNDLWFEVYTRLCKTEPHHFRGSAGAVMESSGSQISLNYTSWFKMMEVCNKTSNFMNRVHCCFFFVCLVFIFCFSFFAVQWSSLSDATLHRIPWWW